MPKVVKTTDVPGDPKRLYIYLYCDKLGCYKSATKKKAAKSWLSLSESKRRRFLKTCRLKKDLNNTQRVLSTEPFLKKLYNSTVEDISNKNIKDKEQDDSCIDADKEVQNESLNNDTRQENKTSLDGVSELQNETCLDGVSEVQIERYLENDNNEQNATYLHEQQKNKTNLDDDNERNNNTCLDNDDTEEQNNLVVIVVDESHNNDKDEQRDIKKHIDVNSICKEINGSDAESSNTEEQLNEGTGTNGNETNADNVKMGFINNIKEPIAPTLKNWKELYVYLNKDKNIKYQDVNVSDTVRRTYQVLLMKIRKEYVEHYIQYLESLSDKQLYEHYLKES